MERGINQLQCDGTVGGVWRVECGVWSREIRGKDSKELVNAK